MPEWDPDITIDEALVRAVLAQFSELDARSVRLVPPDAREAFFETATRARA